MTRSDPDFKARGQLKELHVIERISDGLWQRVFYASKETALKRVAEKYGAGWHVVTFTRKAP